MTNSRQLFLEQSRRRDGESVAGHLAQPVHALIQAGFDEHALTRGLILSAVNTMTDVPLAQRKLALQPLIDWAVNVIKMSRH